MVKSAAGVFIQAVHDDMADGAPQWARVYRTVRHAIDAGALGAGMRLPSARQLALEWRVSRGAVDEAFANLQTEGLLERRVGDGTYVAATAAPPAAAIRREPTQPAQQVLQRQRGIHVPRERTEAAARSTRPPPLHPRAMPLDDFPLALWRRLSVAAYDSEHVALLGGGAPSGLPALREAIVRYLASARGLSCRPEQVLVVGSPREGITTLARYLLAPGDAVAVEDPSHPSLAQLFSVLGAKVAAITLDGSGFDVAQLRRSAEHARLVYLHPLAQYPLGQITSMARGDELLAWAAEREAWIIEGHYNDEWLPRSQQLPTLFQRDAAQRVCLLGTFEGVMFPSLRVGYLVLPAHHAPAIIAAHAGRGERVPLPTQWALAQFIDSGALSRHLHHTREQLQRRRMVVQQTLDDALPSGLRQSSLDTGAQVCLHLPSALSDLVATTALRQRRIAVEPLSAMCWQQGACNGLVLGTMGWREGVVVDTLRTVCAVLRELLASLPAGASASTKAPA